MISPRREQRAFEEFVADASGRLMRTAFLLCGDRGHAEDLVQSRCSVRRGGGIGTGSSPKRTRAGSW